jgi:hypothetical protein
MILLSVRDESPKIKARDNVVGCWQGQGKSEDNVKVRTILESDLYS